jgi:hypothetical protein
MSRSSDADDALELRVREAVDEQYVVIVAVLLLLSVGGLWASYTAYVDPGTQTETRTTSEWRRTATFDHGSTVTADNPVYDTGQQLRNQQAYFPLISPDLDGEYRFGYAASGSGDVDIDIDLRLILRGRSDGTTLWQRSRQLQRTGAAGVAPGDGTTAEFGFDMNRTRLRLERIDGTFGQVPGEPVVVVQARTRMTGRINDRVVNREFVDELRLTRDGDAFVVSDPGEITNATRRTTTVLVPREYSPLRRVGGPLAVVLGLGGTLGLVAARRQGEITLSPDERARLTHQEYAEWISEGSIPDRPDPDDPNVVPMASLPDLVDVAADTNERVLYDPDREQYAVFGGDRMYVCGRLHAADPGAEPAAEAPDRPDEE